MANDSKEILTILAKVFTMTQQKFDITTVNDDLSLYIMDKEMQLGNLVQLYDFLINPFYDFARIIAEKIYKAFRSGTKTGMVNLQKVKTGYFSPISGLWNHGEKEVVNEIRIFLLRIFATAENPFEYIKQFIKLPK